MERYLLFYGHMATPTSWYNPLHCSGALTWSANDVVGIEVFNL